MMKKNYQAPATTVVSVEPHAHILNGGSPVNRVTTDSSVGIGYNGGSSQAARSKEANYDVWNDNWSE